MATEPRSDWGRRLVPKDLIIRDCESLFHDCEVLFVCVRSDQVYRLAEQYGKALSEGQSFVSFSAGIELLEIKRRLLPSGCAVARAIANINIASGRGVTLIFSASSMQGDERLNLTCKILERLGTVLRLKTEPELDRISLVSGTLPAIAAIFCDALAASGARIGVRDEYLNEIIPAAVHGTLDTMAELGIPASLMAELVATPGGLVASASTELERAGFSGIVRNWLPYIENTLEQETKKENADV